MGLLKSHSAYPSTLSSFLLAVTLLSICTLLLKKNVKANRQSQLGARAPAVPSRLPFGELLKLMLRMGLDLTRANSGISILLDIGRANRTDTVLDLIHKYTRVPGGTVELSAPGISTIITDNLDNIRTIMSTQVMLMALLSHSLTDAEKFDCFGKGERYYNIWKGLLGGSIINST
jgi:hypothetical protein